MAAEAGYQEAVRMLIRLLHDGEKGFREVARMLSGEEYRRFYLEEAEVRTVYAAELERALEGQTGSPIQEDGTMLGSLHRTYFELRDALGADDSKLLGLSEQCERLMARMYRDALAGTMPDEMRAMVVHQDEHVQRVHAILRRFRADAALEHGEVTRTAKG